MAARLLQVRAVRIVFEQGQQGLKRRAHFADDSKIDRRTPPDILGPDIDLRDLHTRAARIELAVRKVGSQHQKHVAIDHGVIAG